MTAQRNPWVWLLGGWIGLIFFSSSSLAGQKSERAFSYLSEIFFGQTQTDISPQSLIHLLADKSVHVGLFCVLGILFWKTLPQVAKKTEVILLFGTVVGSCSELLQRFARGRDPAISDVLINIAGTAIGIAVSLAINKLWTRSVKLVQA